MKAVSIEKIAKNPISVYHPPIRNTKRWAAMDLKHIHHLISKGEDLKNKTEQVRSKPETKDLKLKLLPSAIFSGTFEVRTDSSRLSVSNMLCIDIDNLNEKLEWVKERINYLEDFVLMSFISPSGNGLKVIVPIDEELHSFKDWYYSISCFLSEKIGLELTFFDQKCSNVSRCNLLCHDPEAFINQKFYKEGKTIKLIDPSSYLAKRDEVITPTSQVFIQDHTQNDFKNYQRTLDFNLKDSESNFMNFLYLTEKEEGIYDKGREPWIQKLACRCNKFGMSEAICLELTKKHLENHPNSLKKEDPINVKTHILNPIKDSYKRYAKDFNTWKIESSNKKKFINVGIMRTAKQRILDAYNQPDIKKLFDVFWQTGELAILFGDTGLGKSILAIMIADSISKGISALGLTNENDSMPVLFYDFELSDKQFEKRYTVDGVMHDFSESFLNDNLDMNELCSKNPDLDLDEIVYQKIKSDIEFHKPKAVFVDNITFLKTDGQQKGDVAKDIMMKLNSLKKEFQISILVLAHTPKKNQSEILGINHLAGSKHISNFADSVFAVGQSSNDPKLKYLKQIKPSRSSEMIYDASNVLLCEIIKDDKMLTFSNNGFGHELDLLSTKHEAKEDLQKQIAELKNKGKTFREIAGELNISKSQAEREFKKAQI